MGIRRNVKSLTSTQRGKFVAAVKELHRQGRYQPFVDSHIAWATPPFAGPSFAHVTASFAPWHRYFILEFERALQSVDATVNLPYWDFTVQRSPTAIPWTSDFMGGNGTGADNAVSTGPFRQGQWVIGTNTTHAFIKRTLGANSTTLPTATQLGTLMAMTAYSAPPWDGSDDNAFVGHLEGWGDIDGSTMHNQVHQWISGTMAGGAAPADPIFWMLHSFLDKVWADWQARHPSVPQYLPDTPVQNKVDRNMPLQPWGDPVTPAYVLNHTQWYTYQ